MKKYLIYGFKIFVLSNAATQVTMLWCSNQVLAGYTPTLTTYLGIVALTFGISFFPTFIFSIFLTGLKTIKGDFNEPSK